MSEHEGFCVPLAEAMFFDVPILAYHSSAIPYTMEDGGVLLHRKDFVLAAGWIHRIVSDEKLRDYLIERQRDRLKCFSYETVAAQLKSILEGVMAPQS